MPRGPRVLDTSLDGLDSGPVLKVREKSLDELANELVLRHEELLSRELKELIKNYYNEQKATQEMKND